MKHTGNQGDTFVVYARHRGVTPQAVRAALKRNRVVCFEDGSIDRAMTDMSWPITKRREAKAGGILTDYDVERAKKMRADRQMAELRLQKARNELISVAAVRSAFHAVGANTRSKLYSMVDRVAALVHSAKTEHECDRILRDEIEKVCLALNSETLDMANGEQSDDE